MRTQEERDEQTLDIVFMLLRGAVLFVPIAVVVAILDALLARVG